MRTNLKASCLVFALAIVLTLTQSASALLGGLLPLGFVRAERTKLFLNGQPYRFAGLNVYNANSNDTCWYQFSTPGLYESLRQIGGGQNAIRAWFFQNLATTSQGTRDWSRFDRTIDAARRTGSKVIVVLGNQWADCEGWPDAASGYKNQAWYDSGYKTAPGSPGMPSTYRTWVAEVVARYRSSPDVLMWQLLNEAEDLTSLGGACAPNASASLKTFASDMAGVVKSIDRVHLLSLGTIGSGQCGASFNEYKDLHSVPGIDLCEIHDYTHATMPGDQYNGLAFRLQQCRELGKPLFVGEVGAKPSEIPGTIADRANLFGEKFRVQTAAGVVGQMLWAWADAAHGGSKLNDFDIGPGDPALIALGAVSCQGWGLFRTSCPGGLNL